ncbi:MAG: repressor LexA [Bacteroidetes bacterium]|nr:repressor LexA [Bacteroidota bacterium]
MHNGRLPSVRELMKELGYKSPRSAAEVIEKLLKKGVLIRKPDGSLQLMQGKIEEENRAQTVNIPMVGTVACGLPILAEENIDAMIPVSIKIAKPDNTYFFLRASGDSMNEKGIDTGDLVLIKQQASAINGDLVVALVDNEATIKEFQHRGQMILLMPRSTNRSHQPIVLTSDFKIQGIVIDVIKSF